jgi:hypothetical protein
MEECESEALAGADAILSKIAADFEALDIAIDAAIVHLTGNAGEAAKDVTALLRAKEAAQKGAALAKSLSVS